MLEIWGGTEGGLQQGTALAAASRGSGPQGNSLGEKQNPTKRGGELDAGEAPVELWVGPWQATETRKTRPPLSRTQIPDSEGL